MIIRKYGATLIMVFIILIVFTGFFLLSFMDGEFNAEPVMLGIGMAAVILFQYNILKKVYKHLERITLLIVDLLCTLSIIVIYTISPENGVSQFWWVLAGNIAMTVVIAVIRKVKNFGRANWAFMIISVALVGSTLVLGSSIGGAKNWIRVGGISVQPSEFAKILFIIVSAYFISTRNRKRELWPYVAYTAVCVLILVACRDLGAALLFCGTFIVVFYVGTGNWPLTLGSVGIAAIGAYASYYIFPHVKTRVDIWLDPWTHYADQGYQIVQGLMAIASGGLIGAGVGLGMPDTIPAAHTDYIFASFCEEFGIIAGIILIVFYLIFIIRGIIIALNAKNRFDALLVFGCTVMLSLQSFIIIGGVIKLIPLTGITLPFMSYGGSSMLSSFIELGIIEGVAIKNGESDESLINEMGGEVE